MINPKISVIVPLAPGEEDWRNLLRDLSDLPENSEILLISSDKNPEIGDLELKSAVKFLSSKPGRASQMNYGSDMAQGDYLWFLHADSRFDKNTIPALLKSISQHPNSLLFFELAFIKSKLSLMIINEIGAKFRSNILKTPFGDQGFCLKKSLFNRVGRYQEGVKYGEDHLLTRQAKRCKVSLKPVNSKLFTSARKYQNHGWLKTTILHQYLWIKQAFGDSLS